MKAFDVTLASFLPSASTAAATTTTATATTTATIDHPSGQFLPLKFVAVPLIMMEAKQKKLAQQMKKRELGFKESFVQPLESLLSFAPWLWHCGRAHALKLGRHVFDSF